MGLLGQASSARSLSLGAKDVLEHLLPGHSMAAPRAPGANGEPEMTALPFALQVDPLAANFLFTVHGPLAADTLEGGRVAHNMAAGSAEGIAAARSFGDLSHAVYVPIDAPKSGAGDLFIVDYWNSP